MQERWTLVKVSKVTRERLEAVRDSMLLADSVGLRNLERDNRDRVSLDQVISLLIDIRERHAERRKRSAAKRRTRRPATPEKLEEVMETFWQELLASAPDAEKSPKSVV